MTWHLICCFVFFKLYATTINPISSKFMYWIECFCTVYPKKYAHGFVVLCFVVVMQLFIMNSHEVFIHIHQGCFAGTGAIVRLPQCQWSKPDGYGKISQCITTTKHSKAKTMCIFLGIYCNCYRSYTRHRRRGSFHKFCWMHQCWIRTYYPFSNFTMPIKSQYKKVCVYFFFKVCKNPLNIYGWHVSLPEATIHIKPTDNLLSRLSLWLGHCES